jgi:small-conductance mechanosensitive channel
MSEDSSVAAQILDLRRQLTEAQADLLAAQQANDAATSEVSALNAKLADLPKMTARLAELEGLLASPLPGSSIVTVTYSDGRVKYAAPDGNKYRTAVEASRHMVVLALMNIGMTEAQAENVMQHHDDIVKALTS